MRGRWSWADVRAGWIDHERGQGFRATCQVGTADYRAGWVAAWILEGIGRI